MENKEIEKKRKEFVKSLDTSSLNLLIKDQKDLIEKAEKEYYKRKDRTIGSKIGEEVDWIISGGIIILILGLFYMGAVPVYFGVNDELMTPSNSSLMNYTSAINLVSNITYSKIILEFHDIGKESPTLYFWLFWFAVFVIFVYPIFNIIYYAIRKKYLKNGNNKTRK